MATFPTPIHPGQQRRPKYGNRKTVRGGLKFDSKKEAGRWDALLMLERAGVIERLRRQVTYRLEVRGVLVCKYIADHVYRTEEGETVVEDVKGMKTAVYRLKKKLMKACHGIEIREV